MDKDDRSVGSHHGWGPQLQIRGRGCLPWGNNWPNVGGLLLLHLQVYFWDTLAGAVALLSSRAVRRCSPPRPSGPCLRHQVPAHRMQGVSQQGLLPSGPAHTRFDGEVSRLPARDGSTSRVSRRNRFHKALTDGLGSSTLLVSLSPLPKISINQFWHQGLDDLPGSSPWAVGGTGRTVIQCTPRIHGCVLCRSQDDQVSWRHTPHGGVSSVPGPCVMPSWSVSR